MELLQLACCRSSEPWRSMRRHFCFWLVSFILLCPSGRRFSQPLFVGGAAMKGVVRVAVLSVLLQQTGHKALVARALLQSRQLNILETYNASRPNLSRNNSRIRNTIGSHSSTSTFRDATADDTPDNVLGVSNNSAEITKEGRPNGTILEYPASSLQSMPAPPWGNFRRPMDIRFRSQSGESFETAGRLLHQLSRILSAKRALLKRLQRTKPQTHSQTKLHTQPQILPKTPGSAANVLEILAVEEVSCRRAQQAIVAIDGGSSKTQPSLFSVLTESCTESKRAGRHVLTDTLKFVGDGGKFFGVRQLLERWLQRVAREKGDEPKQPQAITNYQKDLLQLGFPLLEQAAEELVNNLLTNMVELIEKRMSKAEQREAKALAIPVIFHSTAGLRDFPRWYREGLFTALRRAINSAPSVRGFVFFTNQEFTRPISGQFEGICAFLTANYLLGNLAKMKAEQQVHERTDAAQTDDTLRRLREEAELSRRKDELIDESEPERLRSVFAGSAGGGERGLDRTSPTALECADAECSGAVPFSLGDSITRCRSGIPDIRFCAHEYLAAIVESGGASMQIAFPVRRLDLLPPDTQLYNLQRSGFLSEDYPPTDVVAVSFMQLGSNSAGGLFLKVLCAPGSPFVSKDGLCTNPCFHKGYNQPCSAGEVVISDTGEVTVLEDPLHNRLRPAAVFCGEDNAEVFVKTSTEVECRASKLDPLEPLQRRLDISNCKRIVGSGNFDQCIDAVNRYLINPQFPLPANQEAIAAGFENPSQIFSFFSSRAPLLITGNSLVIPMRNLQTAGFLSEGALLFTEQDISQIRKASENYCSTPIVRDSSGTLRLSRNGFLKKSSLYRSEPPEDTIFLNTVTEVSIPDSSANATVAVDLEKGMSAGQDEVVETSRGGETGLKIDSLNYENCQRLATIVALLDSIYTGVETPSLVFFTSELQATITGARGNQQKGKHPRKYIGKLGWQIGTILRHMSNEGRWRKMVYELGAAHSLHDRMGRENRSRAFTST